MLIRGEQAEPTPLAMSVGQTAVAFGVSTSLVYDLIHRGQLPAIALGGRLLVPKAAIDGLFQEALSHVPVTKITTPRDIESTGGEGLAEVPRPAAATGRR
jgi:excisionase family DNA binding protein